MDKDEPQPNQPTSAKLERIGISLSGGGVRAVGFHLGLLETLERLQLLDKVVILSSVSGGSFVGTGYALAQHSGQCFNRYFGNCYEFIPKLNMLEELLKGMASPEYPSPSGRRDLITCVANVYDSYYNQYFPNVDTTDSARFEELWKPPAPGAHLKEIIFNATEFQTGTAFRFQKSNFRNLIGNANIQLCPEHAQKIRMADIMAASSCIPGGMEPMFFPDDFHWPDDRDFGAPRKTCGEIKTELRRNLNDRFRIHKNAEVDYFALMDGGVYDNQGMVSLLLAMNRLVSKVPVTNNTQCVCGSSLNSDRPEPGPDAWARWLAGETIHGGEEHDGKLDVGWSEVDLLIISDTPVRKDSMYPKITEPAGEKQLRKTIDVIPKQHRQAKPGLLKKLTVGGLDKILMGIVALLSASMAFTVHEEFGDNSMDISDFNGIADEILQIGVPLLLTGIILFGLLKIRKGTLGLSNDLYSLIPRSEWGARKPWFYIKKLKLADLFNMFSLRMGSMTALTTSIFMNRIRSLSYSAAYSREDMDEHLISNQIFTLEQLDNGIPIDWQGEWPESLPSLNRDANAIVILAAHMQTKLWVNQLEKGTHDDKTRTMNDDLLSAARQTVAEFNNKREALGLRALDELDVLVICGQLTTCYNILRHTYGAPENLQVFEHAGDLWRTLQSDPAALLDDRRQQVQERNAS